MSLINKPCKGCSHPTVCRTHGCAAIEYTRNKAVEVISLYVLTRSINDYNQDGEYFVAVFHKKPTVEQLLENGVSKEEVFHVLEKGGRRVFEDEWSHLRPYNIDKATGKKINA
jgi:hypothetical protein